MSDGAIITLMIGRIQEAVTKLIIHHIRGLTKDNVCNVSVEHCCALRHLQRFLGHFVNIASVQHTMFRFDFYAMPWELGF